jgi:hypothetical protein
MAMRKNTSEIKLKRSQIDARWIPIRKSFSRSQNSLARDIIVRHTKSNGDTLYMKVTTNTIFYNEKEVLLVAARDITDEKIFEKNLKENRSNFHLYSTAPRMV